MIAVMWAQQKEVTGCKAAKYCGKSTDFNQTKLHLNADSVSDSYLHSVVLVVVIVYTHTFTHTHTHTYDGNKYLPDKSFWKINFYMF